MEKQASETKKSSTKQGKKNKASKGAKSGKTNKKTGKKGSVSKSGSGSTSTCSSRLEKLAQPMPKQMKAVLEQFHEKLEPERLSKLNEKLLNNVPKKVGDADRK